MSAQVCVLRRAPHLPASAAGTVFRCRENGYEAFEETSGSCLGATIVSDEKTFIVVRNFHALLFIILSTKWTMSYANKSTRRGDRVEKYLVTNPPPQKIQTV